MGKDSELSRWNPFREQERLQDEMRSLFWRSGDGEFPLAASSDFGDWIPAVDIAEDDDEFTITADLPEVKKDQVKVTPIH